MYKMIIVDDHRHVVDGIKKFVNWTEIGIEIIDTACSGEEGVQKTRMHCPDFVLTDISMPGMDGLDMIKSIIEEGIKTKFVILTAYNEFEYAKYAVKYGVLDYIEKPVLPKQILEAMKKVVGVCDEEKRLKENEKKIRQQLADNMPVITERFIEELIDGNIKNEVELLEKVEFLGLNLSSKSFKVIALQIDSYENFLSEFKEEDRQFMKFSITTLVCEFLGIINTYVNFKERNSYFILGNSILLNDYTDEDDALLSKLEAVIIKCSALFHVSISMGVGDSQYDLLKIKESFIQASESLKYKMYFGNGKVIFYKDIIHTQLITPVLHLYDRSALIDGLKMRSPKLVNECLNHAFSMIHNSKFIRIDYLKMIMNEMLSTAVITLFQMGEKLPENYLKGKLVWGVVETLETLEEIELWIRELFNSILSNTGQKQNQRNLRVVEQMLEYVRENYTKEISLIELSKHIYLTPNYLSILFSKHMGKQFNDYLCEFRVGKAKELLLTGNYKVYEVGEIIGYKNLDYFRKIFKEYTGVSPSEFLK